MGECRYCIIVRELSKRRVCNNPTDSEEMQQFWIYLFKSYTTQCQNSEGKQSINDQFILLRPTPFGFKPGCKSENCLVERNYLFFFKEQELTSALVLDYSAVTGNYFKSSE